MDKEEHIEGFSLDPDEVKDPPKEVRFIYQKARHHRTLHADGAWAGITPQMEVQVAFFNDLKPMPDEVIHAIKEDGTLGRELRRTHNPLNMIREADVTVVMNVLVMKNTISLLSRLVEEIESRIQTESKREGADAGRAEPSAKESE